MKKHVGTKLLNSKISGLWLAFFIILCIAIVAVAGAPLSLRYHGQQESVALAQVLRKNAWDAVLDLVRDVQREASAQTMAEAVAKGDKQTAAQELRQYARGEAHPVPYAVVLPDQTVFISSLGAEAPPISPQMLASMQRMEQGELTVSIAFSPLMNEDTETIAYAASRIVQNGSTTGYLFLGLNEAHFQQLLKVPEGYSIAVIDGDKVVYSAMRNQVLLHQLIQQKGEPGSPLQDYAVATERIVGECYLYTLRNISGMREAVSALAAAVAITCGVFLVVVAFLLRIEWKKEQSSRSKLQAVVADSQHMNLDFHIDTSDSDAFNMLYETINNVMDHVRELVQQNEELAQRRSRMEMKHLQGQFNPHFVFNLLANLQYMITTDTRRAGEMISMLSRLLRYSIQNGDVEVVLQTDINHMENYFILQKVRFGAKLEYAIDIPEQLQHCMVPKLLVQPLIENSIKHNLDKTDYLKIEISACKEGENVRFVVKDNGQGIAPQDLDNLRKRIENADDNTDHIGLLNVHRTLQIKYGNEYGIDLYSVYNRGTTVSLTLPYQTRDV